MSRVRLLTTPRHLSTTVLAVLFVMLAISPHYTANATAASTLGEVETSYDIRPTGFVYDTLDNRVDDTMTTNFDTWPTNDTGIYVGSYVRESRFNLTRNVTTWGSSYLNVTYTTRFSSRQIMSGASLTRIRLPFDMVVPGNGSLWNITLSLYDVDADRLLIDRVDIVGPFLLTPGTLPRTTLEVIDGRWYYYLRAPILSDTTYRWMWNATDLFVGDNITLYLTDDDVGDDGYIGGRLQFYDNLTTTDVDVSADFGVSYMFIESMPRNGYTGLSASVVYSASAFFLGSLYLEQQAIDLTPYNGVKADYAVYIPLFSSAVDANITGRITVDVCSTIIYDETSSWRDGLIVRATNITLGGCGSNDTLSVRYRPANAASSSVVVIGSISPLIHDTTVSTYTHSIIHQGGALLPYTERFFFNPIVKMMVFNASLAGIHGASNQTDRTAIVTANLFSTTKRLSSFTSTLTFTGFTYGACSTALGIGGILPTGSTCSKAADFVSDTVAGAKVAADIVKDAASRGADAIHDLGIGAVDMVSNIAQTIADIGSTILDAIETIGSRLFGILKQIAEKVYLFLGNLIVIMFYVGALAFIVISAVAAGLLVTMFKLLIKGRPDLIMRAVRGRLTKDELEEILLDAEGGPA